MPGIVANTGDPNDSPSEDVFVGPKMSDIRPCKFCSKCKGAIFMELYTIYNGVILCQLCSISHNIEENRETARTGMKRCAEDMVATSSKKFRAVGVGATVVVQVPKVDRGPLDGQNIVGKVLDIKNDLYQIGTSSGILRNWVPRNAISPTPYSFQGEVPSIKKSMRELAILASQFGGQGYKKCHCKGRCDTNRCLCKKNHLLCNSRCHSSTTCLNK